MDNHSFEFNLNGEGSKVSKQSVEEVLKDDLNRSEEGYILGDYMSVSDGKISFNSSYVMYPLFFPSLIQLFTVRSEVSISGESFLVSTISSGLF